MAGRRTIVVGAGQIPCAAIGNGRAIAVLLAREGADVLCVDREAARAEETVELIRGECGRASAFAADIAAAGGAESIVGAAVSRWGGFDTLINNVGIGAAVIGGDGPAHIASEDAFDLILATNLRGTWRMLKAAIPVLRGQGGAIVNISSLAAIAGSNKIAYEVSKAGVNRMTTSVALANARYGVRCNAVMPGMIDTPMAVIGTVNRRGISAEQARADRNALIPLAGGMGTAWDTAYAALFLASDEAKFITGALLPVDGGMSVRIG